VPRRRHEHQCRIFPGVTRDAVLAQLTQLADDPAVTVSIPEVRGPIAPPAPLTRQVMGPIEQLARQMWPGVPVISA
jgi:hypothetical protein